MVKARYVKDGLTYLYSIIFLTILLLPIYFMITTSFKMPVDSFAVPPKVFHFRPTLLNYVELSKRQELGRIFLNTLYVSLATTILVTSIALLGAMSLARFHFTGKRPLAFFILSMRMAPAIAVLLPTYLLFQRVGLLNKVNGLVLLYSAFNLPFGIWFLRSFVMTIPKEIEESGMIDGLTRFGAFCTLTVRLCSGGIAASGVFTFMAAWNEFLFGLALTNVYSRTLPVAVTAFLGERGVDWGPMAALGTIVSLPLLIMTLAVQKYIVAGLTLGAVKE